MIEPDTLRILATISSVIGSGLLAWRVKRILDALTLVAAAHELNIQQLMPTHEGDIYNLGNATKHVERAKGTWLLVFGFLLLGLSGVLNFIALML
ncbi:hypothetical protein [Brucella gallinifaecis]|uniref:hypothetical protein n=1 Tax=Brucella TaxID=234 RepID=UPI002362B1FF|nr:hypothetical protein [Brucella gallinifaecis]